MRTDVLMYSNFNPTHSERFPVVRLETNVLGKTNRYTHNVRIYVFIVGKIVETGFFSAA